MHYQVRGTGQALVFLNGLGMSTRDWVKQVEFFSESYRVITFDPRGHGLSTKPDGPYSMQLFADEAAELLQSLLASPAHLVGLSMGGMIAFQMAVSSPELLKTMVIVNSGPEFIIRTARQRFEIVKREFITRFLGMRRLSEFLSGRLFPDPKQLKDRELMKMHWAENEKNAYLASFRALKGWSVTNHLKNIRCPTLVISAEEDYTPVTFKEWYVGRMPNAELVIVPNSRHVTPLDQPDLFNRIVADFLSRHP